MKIEFIPSTQDISDYVDPPEPSKKHIPQWYKDSPSFNLKDVKFNEFGEFKDLELKMCMPFLDSLTSGYIQKTWTDIHIAYNDNNDLELHTNERPTIPIIEGRSSAKVKIPDEFYQVEFVWKTPYLPKLPKGYSILFTHPFNRSDLPFHTFSGIVDSDTFYHTRNGSYPVWIKKDFAGIIPAGTPMYQMIPFKRDDWESVILGYDEKSMNKRNFERFKTLAFYYKKFHWNKKTFN